MWLLHMEEQFQGYRCQYLRYVLTLLRTVRNVNVTYEDERYTEI
jgi:hypothetical protein